MRVKISVPNNLSEIKLSQYQKFLKAQEENQDGTGGRGAGLR